MASANVNMRDFKRTVVTVRIPRRLMLRLRVGMALMRLGAAVATIGFKEERVDG